ncbi:hypothetical protein [Streptomyces mangrovisoli]|uniref:hypothetical protein n=1 Tax=Streptomyces mangrovisoli TaxID=1428628 RepID=UPI000B044778|nr:hypothetical protein [Streptomyces mangrovisoli]
MPAAAATDVSYAYDPQDRTVTGADGTTDAPALSFGTSYRSSLARGTTVYYGVDLDARSTAYVSVTAVPPAGGSVSATDGVKVSLQDGGGRSCSLSTEGFGPGRSPHPVTALVARETSPGRTLCRDAGRYYVVVERRDAVSSSSGDWGLEITPVSEAPLQGGALAGSPEPWDSASPEPLAGAARVRRGGAGFASAAPLGQGVWRDDIAPGQTLFYKVPVDWGRQLSATAELGGSGTGHGYVGGALEITLCNPARGPVTDTALSYDGSPKSAALDPLPPVRYANRNGVLDQVGEVRFAGSYYLVVHLSAQMAATYGDGPFSVTLRVRIDGTVQPGPAYAGESVPKGLFAVSAAERRAADTGVSADGTTAMRALAYGGIGGGTALLLGLALWTLALRRGTPA